MDDPAAERLRNAGGAGRSGRRDDDRLVGIATLERLHDRRRGLDFADRDRVDPHASPPRIDPGPQAEALADPPPVSGVAQSAPKQPPEKERRGTIQRRRIGEPHHRVPPVGPPSYTFTRPIRPRGDFNALHVSTSHRLRAALVRGVSGSSRAVAGPHAKHRGECFERQSDAPMPALHLPNRRKHLQLRPRKRRPGLQRRIHAGLGAQQILDPPLWRLLGDQDHRSFTQQASPDHVPDPRDAPRRAKPDIEGHPIAA